MEKITVIRDLLPQGAQVEIAKNLKMSISKVNHVLNGRSTDLKVINYVIDYYADYKQKQAAAIERMNALV